MPRPPAMDKHIPTEREKKEKAGESAAIVHSLRSKMRHRMKMKC